jgi:hypothetical protein
MRSGIGGADNDVRNAGSRQRIDAGRGLSMVSAGFERDEHCRAAGPLAGLAKCVFFRVRATEPLVPTLAEKVSLRIDNDRAHHGVGLDKAFASPSQLEGPTHDGFGIGKSLRHCKTIVCGRISPGSNQFKPVR